MAYKKSENVILHIDQPIEDDILVNALRKAVFNYPKVKKVLLVWEQNIKLLTQKEILDRNWLK